MASSTASSSAEQRIDLLWPQVHALTLLAQLGSFTQVAQRLGLSKAGVSQRITELERAVGQTLVQRTTRSVRLTEAGQRLVDETTESFAQIARSVSETRDLAAQPRGLVRVTAPVALGRQHVAPDNHVAWKLCDSRSVLVASAAYLRRRGTPREPADLAHHACLPYLRPGPAHWKFERLQRGDPERVGVAVQGPFRASNSELLRGAALAGLGLALLPDFSAVEALRTWRLREVMAPWRPVGFFGDAVYAMRPWSPNTPKAVQALVAHLRDAFRAGFDAPPDAGASARSKKSPPA